MNKQIMQTSNSIQLNYPNFESTISQETILVDFWAEWCAPCKMLNPILEEVAIELKDKLKVGKVNVDDNRTIANKYGIMNIPTMILFKDGKKVYQFVGVQSKERIIHILNKHL